MLVAPIVTGNTIFNIQTALSGNIAGIEFGGNVSNGVIDHNRIFAFTVYQHCFIRCIWSIPFDAQPM